MSRRRDIGRQAPPSPPGSCGPGVWALLMVVQIVGISVRRSSAIAVIRADRGTSQPVHQPRWESTITADAGHIVPRGTPAIDPRMTSRIDTHFYQISRAIVTSAGRYQDVSTCTGIATSDRRLLGQSTPGRIRTCDRRFRKPLLYPTELRAQLARRSSAWRLTRLGVVPPSRAAPGRIRTCDLRFRKPPLYPPELRARSLPRLDFPASNGLLSTGLRNEYNETEPPSQL